MEISDRMPLNFFFEGRLSSTCGNRLMPWLEADDVGMTAADGGGRLQCIEAIVERKQRMPPESDDDCLLLVERIGDWASFGHVGRSATVSSYFLFAFSHLVALGRRSRTPLTCRLNDVDPKAWLANVLARIADLPASRLHELLPRE